MNQAEFREALWNGLGRAILYARDHDMSEFRDAILDACLFCHAVDPISEGTRANYMYELIGLTADREFYRDEILKALAGGEDDWHTVQRFEFATYLAADGDTRAHRAIYEGFNPGPLRAVHIGRDLTDMDGLDGFLFAAERVGALQVAGLRPANIDGLLCDAVEKFGEDRTLNALRKSGEQNPAIEAYRLAAEDARKRKSRFKSTDGMPWAEVKTRLADLHHLVGIWGERASAGNLELAAQDLLRAATEEDQLRHLRIFRWRPFPLDHGAILRLTDSENQRVAEAAAEALANINHPSIRELAFRLIEQGRAGRDEAVLMLSRNWHAGDHEIALRWFKEENDRPVRHRLGMHLTTFWKEHPDSASEGHMLLALYERGPCSMCRRLLLPRLVELGQLPDHLREECAYDADAEIRDIVGGC